MQHGEKNNVYEVYNRIAGQFAANRSGNLMEKPYLDRLIGLLPAKAQVLDVGCGTGMPILKYLREQQLTVTGLDGSHEILKIARANFPDTEFVLQDMRLMDLGERFDAILAWHSFFHLSPADQPAMFSRFAEHLKPDGILMFTSGTERGEVWGMNGGENLYHASLDTAEYNELLKQAKFHVIDHTTNDPQCGGATVWLVKYNG